VSAGSFPVDLFRDGDSIHKNPKPAWETRYSAVAPIARDRLK
jgi:hypothetical protein